MILAAASARRRTSVPYPLPIARPYNAPYPAVTPCYVGGNQAIHPSVIDFNHVLGGTWHGWRYWMAMTPFPFGEDEHENPSILVSQDGYHWQPPDGLTNPVYPKEGAFNSDTHITYDPDLDRLVMLWRNTHSDMTSWPRIGTSLDGVSWSAYTELTLDRRMTSPSIMKVAGEWQIYAIENGTATRPAGGTVYLRWRSPDLTTWTDAEVLTGPELVADVWHLSVQHFDGQFWMVMDRGPAHLVGNPDGYRAAASLDGLTWTNAADDFMAPIGLDYETFQHYRADIQPHEDGQHVRLWYSHQKDSAVGEWGTSFTQVRRDEWPAPPTP